jgi:hypothetical protein
MVVFFSILLLSHPTNTYPKTMKKRVILIPIQGSEEAVEIPINELPKDPNELVDILKTETAPLMTWLKCAVNIKQHTILMEN